MEHKFDVWFQMCADVRATLDFDRKASLCLDRETPRSAVCLNKRKRTHESPLLSRKISRVLPKQPTRTLPQDCWSRVFSFLPATSHGLVHYICRMFRKVNSLAGSWPASLQGLKLRDSDLAFFQQIPFTHIALGSDCRVGVGTLGSFLKDTKRDCLIVLSIKNLVSPTLSCLALPSLTQLELHGCGLRADDVLALCSNLRHLVSLDLSANPFPDHALTKLVKCKDLIALNLSGCEGVSDMGLLHLSHNALRVLSVAGVKCLSDAGLLNLQRVASLEALNLSNLPKVTDAGILSLGGLPLLESLDVSGTNITALSLVARLFSLRLVCLLRCPGLPLKTVFDHMPLGTQVVMEQHAFGDHNPWFKQ